MLKYVLRPDISFYRHHHRHHHHQQQQKRPIVLRMTYGIATEPNRRLDAMAACISTVTLSWRKLCLHRMSATSTYRTVAGLFFRCVLWLSDTSYAAKVSEEVNRKLPARNTTVQRFILYTDANCYRVFGSGTDLISLLILFIFLMGRPSSKKA